MKKIGIITSTRAEYGLLQPLIIELRKYETKKLRISLVVTGTHLLEEYGKTINEIRESNVRIDNIVKVCIKSENENSIAKNQAEILIKFTELFIEEKYSGIVILGDRYETLMVAIAAVNTKTPIFHISGGDTTEGAIDECIRHAITKMSFCHFTTNEISKKRVIQLGENPERVYNVGSTSIDNIINMKLLSKKDALKTVGLEECKYALCTYHPVTLEQTDIEKKVNNFLRAISEFEDIQFVVTKANADMGGSIVNKILEEREKDLKNLHLFSSLGVFRYLSLMKHCEFVLGNSSSGIVEAPALKVPTVNIGDRQKGRLQCNSTINCGESYHEIIEGIKKAESLEMKKIANEVHSPYGEGNAAIKMAQIIVERIKQPINLKKEFYNVG